MSLDTHRGIDAISEHLVNVEQKAYLDRVHQWLAAPDALSSYEEALRKRLSTTGDWFINSPGYQRWKTTPKSLLWLHGMTGCGKAVLSSTVVQDLCEHCQSHASHTLAFFYFESNVTFRQHTTSFIRSLLSQLSRQNEAGVLKLKDLYFACDQGRSQPTDDTLLLTLRSMFQISTATYILLDALDESQNRSRLLDIIQRVHDWEIDNVDLLVTSRCEADIKKILEPLACSDQIIELKPSVMNDDINKYIEHSMSTDRSLSRWRTRPDIQRKIMENLLDKGEGSHERPIVPSLDAC